MKIFFIGAVQFSKDTLKKLISIKANIIGVATKKQSLFNADFFDLSSICIKNSIPCKYVQNINETSIINWIKELKPDIIFCFGWSSLLKKQLLDIPPMGVLGFHLAKLPQNRGRHPLIWALHLDYQKRLPRSFLWMNMQIVVIS